MTNTHQPLTQIVCLDESQDDFYAPWYLNLASKLPPCKWTVPSRLYVRMVVAEAHEENIRFLVHFKLPGSPAQTIEQFNCRSEQELFRAIGEYNEYIIGRPGIEIEILRIVDLQAMSAEDIEVWLDEFAQ